MGPDCAGKAETHDHLAVGDAFDKFKFRPCCDTIFFLFPGEKKRGKDRDFWSNLAPAEIRSFSFFSFFPFSSQAILFLSESGILEELEKQWLVVADDLACAGAVEADVRVLGVVHVQVLLICC